MSQPRRHNSKTCLAPRREERNRSAGFRRRGSLVSVALSARGGPIRVLADINPVLGGHRGVGPTTAGPDRTFAAYRKVHTDRSETRRVSLRRHPDGPGPANDREDRVERQNGLSSAGHACSRVRRPAGADIESRTPVAFTGAARSSVYLASGRE